MLIMLLILMTLWSLVQLNLVIVSGKHGTKAVFPLIARKCQSQYNILGQ